MTRKQQNLVQGCDVWPLALPTVLEWCSFILNIGGGQQCNLGMWVCDLLETGTCRLSRLFELQFASQGLRALIFVMIMFLFCFCF